MTTYDQLAFRIMLDGTLTEQQKTARLQSLAKNAAHAVGSECPECGSRHIDDNGGTEYRCVDCDHQWGTDGERYGF